MFPFSFPRIILLLLASAVALAVSPIEAQTAKQIERKIERQHSFPSDTFFPSDVFRPATPLTRAFPSDIFTPREMRALSAQGVRTVGQSMKMDAGKIARITGAEPRKIQGMQREIGAKMRKQ